jgi:hypothetical protein
MDRAAVSRPRLELPRLHQRRLEHLLLAELHPLREWWGTEHMVRTA